MLLTRSRSCMREDKVWKGLGLIYFACVVVQGDLRLSSVYQVLFGAFV